MSVVTESMASSRGGVLPRGTRVEVFDKGQWYKGGKVQSFDPETQEYEIFWDSFNERTQAGRHEVRREVVEWKRVKHPDGFRLDCKRAPYNDWLEQQPAPRPSQHRQRQRHKQEEVEVAQPWVAPSKRDGGIPEWRSELRTPPKRSKNDWEKRVKKHLKRYSVKGRPAFGVPKKAELPQWQSDRQPLPERSAAAQQARLQRYWGRFAPAEVFNDEEEEDADEPMMKHKKATRKIKKTEEAAAAAAHADDDDHHADAAPAEHDDARAATPPAPPAPEEPTQEPAPAPAAAAEPAEGAAAEEITPGLVLQDGPEGEAARATVFARLAEDGEVSQEALGAHAAELLGCDAEVAAGVPLALRAVGAGQAVTEETFHTVLVALERFSKLKELYPEQELEESIDTDSNQFERSMKLLASWGIEMAHVEEEFLSDSAMDQHITFDRFFTWAIRPRS